MAEDGSFALAAVNHGVVDGWIQVVVDLNDVDGNGGGSGNGMVSVNRSIGSRSMVVEVLREA